MAFGRRTERRLREGRVEGKETTGGERTGGQQRTARGKIGHGMLLAETLAQHPGENQPAAWPNTG